MSTVYISVYMSEQVIPYVVFTAQMFCFLNIFKTHQAGVFEFFQKSCLLMEDNVRTVFSLEFSRSCCLPSMFSIASAEWRY